jgi:hypothetical protein
VAGGGKQATSLASAGQQWDGCREFSRRARLVHDAVKFWGQQQHGQQQHGQLLLSERELSRNFYCNWDQVQAAFALRNTCELCINVLVGLLRAAALCFDWCWQRHWVAVLLQQVTTATRSRHRLLLPSSSFALPPHRLALSGRLTAPFFCSLQLNTFFVLHQSQSCPSVINRHVKSHSAAPWYRQANGNMRVHARAKHLAS